MAANKKKEEQSFNDENNDFRSEDELTITSTTPASDLIPETPSNKNYKKRKKAYDGPAPVPIDLVELKKKSIQELTQIAKGLGVENTNGLKKQNLIYCTLQAQSEKEGQVHAAGVMEKLPDGYGFLRSPDYSDCVQVIPLKVKFDLQKMQSDFLPCLKFSR